MTRFSTLKAAYIVALAAAVANTGAALEVTKATPELCKFPFKYKNVWWSTCTNLDGDAPWCVLKDEYKPEAPKNDWLECDMSKFSTPQATLSDGTVQECVARSYNGTSLYGCSSDSANGPFTCMVADGRTGRCLPVSTGLQTGKQGSNIQTTNTANSGENAVASESDSSSQNIGVVIGSVACVGAAALLAGLFVYRRRQSKQELGWQYQEKTIESLPTGYAAGVAGDPGSRESTASSQMYMPTNPGERVYVVVSTYTPTLSDELEIQPGDKVSILIEYDDGWCQGINHTRGGVKGVFPKHCVDMTSAVTLGDTRPTSMMSDGSAL
jgi:hypothetical protein